jgi:hypothetical protein
VAIGESPIGLGCEIKTHPRTAEAPGDRRAHARSPEAGPHPVLDESEAEAPADQREGRDGRETPHATGVKVEGRKSIAQWAAPERPHLGGELIGEAKRLRRKRPKGGQRSYRQIAAELSQMGYRNSKQLPFSPSSIKAMIES